MPLFTHISICREMSTSKWWICALVTSKMRWRHPLFFRWSKNRSTLGEGNIKIAFALRSNILKNLHFAYRFIIATVSHVNVEIIWQNERQHHLRLSKRLPSIENTNGGHDVALFVRILAQLLDGGGFSSQFATIRKILYYKNRHRFRSMSEKTFLLFSLVCLPDRPYTHAIAEWIFPEWSRFVGMRTKEVMHRYETIVD